MKVSPKEHELNIRLGPSKFSATGFMEGCNISAIELISADKKNMNSLGISTENSAQCLDSIYHKAEQAFGKEIEVKSNFFAKFFESRGKIPSPFIGHGTFEKGETILTNRRTDKYIIITKLGIAMIKSYSFFQGYGSRYRIDPIFIAELVNTKTD